MKKRSWIPLNSLLAAVVLSAALLNIFGGWPRAGSKDAGALPGDATIAVSAAPSREPGGTSGSVETARYDPDSLASALGWHRPPPPPRREQEAATSQPAAKPQEASWIHYLGTITEADGVGYRYFKDEHTGQVIRAAEGKSIDGWRLTAAGNGGFLLANGTNELLVRLPR